MMKAASLQAGLSQLTRRQQSTECNSGGFLGGIRSKLLTAYTWTHKVAQI